MERQRQLKIVEKSETDVFQSKLCLLLLLIRKSIQKHHLKKNLLQFLNDESLNSRF